MLSFSFGYSNPVVIMQRTQIIMYIQAVAIIHDIICIKKKKQLLFCRGMYTEDIKALHVMTGCDDGHDKTVLRLPQVCQPLGLHTFSATLI